MFRLLMAVISKGDSGQHRLGHEPCQTGLWIFEAMFIAVCQDSGVGLNAVRLTANGQIGDPKSF
jgi:hypothetical protein